MCHDIFFLWRYLRYANFMISSPIDTFYWRERRHLPIEIHYDLRVYSAIKGMRCSMNLTFIFSLSPAGKRRDTVTSGYHGEV